MNWPLQLSQFSQVSTQPAQRANQNLLQDPEVCDMNIWSKDIVSSYKLVIIKTLTLRLIITKGSPMC